MIDCPLSFQDIELFFGTSIQDIIDGHDTMGRSNSKLILNIGLDFPACNKMYVIYLVSIGADTLVCDRLETHHPSFRFAQRAIKLPRAKGIGTRSETFECRPVRLGSIESA